MLSYTLKIIIKVWLNSLLQTTSIILMWNDRDKDHEQFKPGLQNHTNALES